MDKSKNKKISFENLIDLIRQWPWVYPRSIEYSVEKWIARSHKHDWYGSYRSDWKEIIYPGGLNIYSPPKFLQKSLLKNYYQVATRHYPEASVRIQVKI